jgi:hypothetical protein
MTFCVKNEYQSVAMSVTVAVEFDITETIAAAPPQKIELFGAQFSEQCPKVWENKSIRFGRHSRGDCLDVDFES